jgi:hypothetical protein
MKYIAYKCSPAKSRQVKHSVYPCLLLCKFTQVKTWICRKDVRAQFPRSTYFINIEWHMAVACCAPCTILSITSI